MQERTLIILGSGCAGLTAAVYAARAELQPLVIEGNQPGGQLTTTTDIENFPGFPEGIGGYELVSRMRKQAERFSAEFISDHVRRMRCENGTIILEGTDVTYRAKALIIATGAAPYLLNVPGEAKYFGCGVSVCATCDGAFYRGKEVAVIGGGDSAVEEALFLTRFCAKVYLVHRRDALRASPIMIKRVFENPKVEIIWDSVLGEVLGDGKRVTELRLRNVKTEADRALPCSAVFIAVGHKPNSDFAKGVLPLDDKGYFVPSSENSTHSSVEGIFLAGDCADASFQQAIVAAGSGAKAAIAAEQWLRQ